MVSSAVTLGAAAIIYGDRMNAIGMHDSEVAGANLGGRAVSSDGMSELQNESECLERGLLEVLSIPTLQEYVSTTAYDRVIEVTHHDLVERMSFVHGHTASFTDKLPFPTIPAS